jgi:hypothetical protein
MPKFPSSAAFPPQIGPPGHEKGPHLSSPQHLPKITGHHFHLLSARHCPRSSVNLPPFHPSSLPSFYRRFVPRKMQIQKNKSKSNIHPMHIRPLFITPPTYTGPGQQTGPIESHLLRIDPKQLTAHPLILENILNVLLTSPPSPRSNLPRITRKTKFLRDLRDPLGALRIKKMTATLQISLASIPPSPWLPSP